MTGIYLSWDRRRLLVRSDAISLPAARVDAREVVPALRAAQQDDGSFGEASEPAVRLVDTLEAVLVLVRLG